LPCPHLPSYNSSYGRVVTLIPSLLLSFLLNVVSSTLCCKVVQPFETLMWLSEEPQWQMKTNLATESCSILLFCFIFLILRELAIKWGPVGRKCWKRKQRGC
jgi:hypothetical protein